MSDDQLVKQAQAAYDALDGMSLYAPERGAAMDRFRALMVEAEQRGLMVPLVHEHR